MKKKKIKVVLKEKKEAPEDLQEGKAKIIGGTLVAFVMWYLGAQGKKCYEDLRKKVPAYKKHPSDMFFDFNGEFWKCAGYDWKACGAIYKQSPGHTGDKWRFLRCMKTRFRKSKPGNQQGKLQKQCSKYTDIGRVAECIYTAESKKLAYSSREGDRKNARELGKFLWLSIGPTGKQSNYFMPINSWLFVIWRQFIQSKQPVNIKFKKDFENYKAGAKYRFRPQLSRHEQALENLMVELLKAGGVTGNIGNIIDLRNSYVAGQLKYVKNRQGIWKKKNMGATSFIKMMYDYINMINNPSMFGTLAKWNKLVTGRAGAKWNLNLTTGVATLQ